MITARPSYSRVKSVLTALKARHDVELQIVCAASALVTRWGRIVDQIREDGFKVNVEIPSVIDGNGLQESAISTGVLLTQLAGTFAALRPDVVMTIADRHETLATAIAASYQNITLCHIQGGEISGSIDDKVRNAVTQLADIHFVATESAGMDVLLMLTRDEHWFYAGASEGGSEYGVHVTGCPSIDIAAEALRLGPVPSTDVIVLQHPVTDQVEEAGEQMRTTIEAVKATGLSATYFWPGEEAGAEAMSKELRLAGLHPIRNKPPLEFLRMLLGCKVLVGNSSVGIRECSFLGVPVVNIGDRQNGRERGPMIVESSHNPKVILTQIEWWQNWYSLMYVRQQDTLYGDGHAGERIASILAGKAQEAVA